MNQEPCPTSMSQSLPPLLIEKLQCTKCGKKGLTAGNGQLVCASCSATVPVRSGRFPDFLNEAERAALEKELRFWSEHFSGKAYVDESEESYQDWIELMGIQGRSEILEIGCGSGALLTRIDAPVKVGIEPAENLLQPSHGFHGIIGTAANLPFRSGTFDVVFFKHSLHHVEDKAQAIREAARTLKPGGKLIVIEPNKAHPQRRLISNPHSVFRKTRLFTRFIGPVESFQTSREVQSLAKSAGLEFRRLRFMQSKYERLTLRQALQRMYAWGLKPFLPEEWLNPNYFIEFSKPLA